MSALLLASPGIAAAPRLPPFKTASRLSTERPLVLAVSLWQTVQFFWSSGRTSLSKKRIASGVNSPLVCWAASGHKPPVRPGEAAGMLQFD